MGKTIMAGMAGRRGRALRHRVAAAAGFLFLLVSGVTGAWAAVGDFAGTYSGTYTGSDNGTWTMRCEPDGAMIGVAWSTAHDLPMAAGEGLITAAGDFSLKMEAEGQILIVMSGNISAGGSVAGTWNNPYTGDKGQLSGRRDLPAELAVFAGAYAGTYAGPDSGTWAGSADAAGNLLGSVTSALTHQTHSMGRVAVCRNGRLIMESMRLFKGFLAPRGPMADRV